MRPMRPSPQTRILIDMTSEEVLEAIKKIIVAQQVLENHQRSNNAETNTIMDSQAYAYAQVREAMKPFMDA
jgi:hypothetical protein